MNEWLSWRNQWKRVADVLLSASLLLTMLPVTFVVAALIRIRMGSPVLFRQVRPGLHGRPFEVMKFRTMNNARDVNGELAPDRVRLTPLGRFLRKTSLDELPQLLNVLRGDMSLVGPRPLLADYLPYYSDREALRHSVRPGITGLAQVAGRNTVSWDDRLEMDVQYVEKLSFALDISILLRTFCIAISRKGVALDSSEVEGNLADIRRSRALSMQSSN